MSYQGVLPTVEAMRKYLASVNWREMADEAAPELLAIFATLPDLLLAGEKDNDRRERLQVVLDLAGLFQGKMGVDRLTACWLSLELAGEDDEGVAQDLVRDLGHRAGHLTPDERLRARKLLLKATVTYAPINPKGSTTVAHEMWFVEGGVPLKRVATRDLQWDQVPADVREVYIREGKPSASFTIYAPRG